jgi:RNA polymerase sigma factor (sigma-70 family)
MADVQIPIALSDLQLARLALKDPRAEEKILRRVYPKIFQIVRFAVGNRKQADDFAQIAAMEVLKSLESFGGVGSIEAWAGRIAYRTTMRAVRKERQTDKMYFPFIDDEVANNETPERSLSRRQLFDVVVSKLEVIPAKRRIPLMLHLAYGYTINEVSELTESPPDTVKDRLKTAFRELRAILEEHPNLRAATLEEML